MSKLYPGQGRVLVKVKKNLTTESGIVLPGSQTAKVLSGESQSSVSIKNSGLSDCTLCPKGSTLYFNKETVSLIASTAEDDLYSVDIDLILAFSD